MYEMATLSRTTFASILSADSGLKSIWDGRVLIVAISYGITNSLQCWRTVKNTFKNMGRNLAPEELRICP